MINMLTLATFVLMAISAYVMQTIALLNSLCDQIDRLVRNFIWGFSNNARKKNLVNWCDMCQPTMHGGDGIMNLKPLNKAFLMKVYFNIITQPHLL